MPPFSRLLRHAGKRWAYSFSSPSPRGAYTTQNNNIGYINKLFELSNRGHPWILRISGTKFQDFRSMRDLKTSTWNCFICFPSFQYYAPVFSTWLQVDKKLVSAHPNAYICLRHKSHSSYGFKNYENSNNFFLK